MYIFLIRSRLRQVCSVCLNTKISVIIRARDTKFGIKVPIFPKQILYISKSIIYMFEYISILS